MSDDDLTAPPPAAEGPELPTSSDLDLDGGFDAVDDLDSVDEPAEPTAVPGPSGGRLALGILGALAVAAVSVVVWVVVTLNLTNQYVGVSVVMGLLVGYVIRVVSGRSTIPVRIIASVVTALGTVAGTLVGEAAYYSAKYHPSLSEAWKRIVKPDMSTILTKQRALTYVVYGAAVLIAFLAAGPQKPKKPALVEGPAELDEAEEAGLTDEAYEPEGDVTE